VVEPNDAAVRDGVRLALEHAALALPVLHDMLKRVGLHAGADRAAAMRKEVDDALAALTTPALVDDEDSGPACVGLNGVIHDAFAEEEEPAALPKEGEEPSDTMVKLGGEAIERAWHEMDDVALQLPPIEFSVEEREHLANACLRAALSSLPVSGEVDEAAEVRTAAADALDILENGGREMEERVRLARSTLAAFRASPQHATEERA